MNVSPSSDSQAEDIRLTEREVQVMHLATEGITSKEMARILACSKRTVDFHLLNIYAKLNVSNRIQALHRAGALGLTRRPWRATKQS